MYEKLHVTIFLLKSDKVNKSFQTSDNRRWRLPHRLIRNNSLPIRLLIVLNRHQVVRQVGKHDETTKNKLLQKRAVEDVVNSSTQQQL